MVLKGGLVSGSVEVINDPDQPIKVLQESQTIIGNQIVVDDDFNQIKRLEFTGSVAGLTFEPLIDISTSNDYVVPASINTRIALTVHVIPNNASNIFSFGIADNATGLNFQTLIPAEIYSAKGETVIIFELLFVVPTGKFIGVFNTSGALRESNTIVQIREVST